LELRDYAEGQDVELLVGESAQVFIECARHGEIDPDDEPRKWTPMRTAINNANPNPVTVRLDLGPPSDWQIQFRGHRTFVKDGKLHVELTIPANSQREFDWALRPSVSTD
jgi:hypothetical protein